MKRVGDFSLALEGLATQERAEVKSYMKCPRVSRKNTHLSFFFTDISRLRRLAK